MNLHPAVLFLLIGLACALEEGEDAAAAAPECPESLTENGNFAAGDCENFYYSCPQGSEVGIKVDCAAPGLRYSFAADECLYPAYVSECPGGKPTDAPTTGEPAAPTEPPFPFSCDDRRSGDYGNPNVPCSQSYVSCSSGMVYYRECQQDLFFDVVSRQCLTVDYVKACGGKRTTDVPPAPTTKKPLPITCRPKGVYFVEDPLGACSSTYYSCSNGVADEFKCAADYLAFDIERDMCDERKYVWACGGKAPAPTTTTPAVPREPVNFDCSEREDGNYVTEGVECPKEYFACSGGIAYAFECPAGLVYYTEENACVAQRTCSGGGSENNCVGRVDGFYGVDCTSYIVCQAQEGFPQFCPEGTVFHNGRAACLRPDEVPAPCGTKPDEAEPDCAGLPLGYYRSEDCDQYWLCEADGSAWVFRCTEGLAFDLTTETCRHKLEVPGCFATTPAPQPDLERFCLGRGKGLYGHPSNCRFGVVCLGGKNVFELPCPPELPRFNPVKGDCDVASEECAANEDNIARVANVEIIE